MRYCGSRWTQSAAIPIQRGPSGLSPLPQRSPLRWESPSLSNLPPDSHRSTEVDSLQLTMSHQNTKIQLTHFQHTKKHKQHKNLFRSVCCIHWQWHTIKVCQGFDPPTEGQPRKCGGGCSLMIQRKERWKEGYDDEKWDRSKTSSFLLEEKG